ncbi:MAG: hypothetical protein ABI641_13990, partial [Caldimonas sp.]
MLGGQLAFHFLNVLLLTLVVAPIVLWRYRRAVLAGMQGGSGAVLPVPPVKARGPEPAAPAAPTQALPEPAAWERRHRRRVFVAVLAAIAVPALLMAALALRLSGYALTPTFLLLKAGIACSIAVPIFAVLTATSFWRAVRIWLVALAALGVAVILMSMLQRLARGATPGLDQLMNFVVVFRLAALDLWLPILLGLAIGAKRVRGVAPLVFSGLLVFGLAPFLGAQLTQWLTSTEVGATWVLTAAGLETGFFLIALPAGLLAWWRLKRLARDFEAKRFSEAQLLARTWWLLMVASQAVQLISLHPAPASVVTTLALSTFAYLLFPPSLALALRLARGNAARPAARTLLLLRVFGNTA